MSTALATREDNALAGFGAFASEGGSRIVGDLLKFSKGFWYAGRDQDEVKPGKKLVAAMATMRHGWVKWVDSKPAIEKMNYIAAGVATTPRYELGDSDKAIWEIDNEGKPKDPWQLTSTFQLADPVNGDEYTFSTTSAGGHSAVRDLCKAYAMGARSRPGKVPLIELSVSSYLHKDKSRGRIMTPVFKLIGWEDNIGANQGELAYDEPAEQHLADEEIPF